MKYLEFEEKMLCGEAKDADLVRYFESEASCLYLTRGATQSDAMDDGHIWDISHREGEFRVEICDDPLDRLQLEAPFYRALYCVEQAQETLINARLISTKGVARKAIERANAWLDLSRIIDSSAEEVNPDLGMNIESYNTHIESSDSHVLWQKL